MWEAIESNKRRSWILVVLMGVLLVALGAAIGGMIHPRQGLGFGALAAAGLWFVLWMVAAFQGDAVMLTSAGAMKIDRQDAPQLWNIVEEMTIASGSAKMPDVYVIDDPSPNAFAIGRNPEKASAVAVTSGLLRILNRDELQGVVGHEIGHLKNRDSAFLVLAGVMLGAIVLLADLFLRGLWHSGRGRRRGGGGEAQAILMVVALALAILAPILAQMLYFACSRRREYLADASAARFTRYPEGLASALEKIAAHHSRPKEVNRVLAPMYIVNPMATLAAVGLFSTHPPTENRIRILRNMAGAGFGDYEAAYRKSLGQAQPLIGRKTLAEDKPAPLRAAGRPPAESRQESAARSHEVVQMLGRLENFIVMNCACGLGIKVPPELKRDIIPCPRCGRQNPVPSARPAAAPEALQYRRQTRGWESVRCACGGVTQLSPHFAASHVACPGCGRRIEIVQ